ncbi:glycosyltransferase family 39 protein [Candidatus Woesearchaeota archaeon]|nr:glycosyltransferase family 39 protein [Candidatus Woesearchaeota archaeon]
MVSGKNFEGVIEKNIKLILGLIFIIFLLISLKGVKPDLSDQPVYIYMGKLITEGEVPYRDFFFSHPPLEIYVDALLLKIFGYNLFILKLVPILFTILTAFFLFKLVKKKFDLVTALGSTILFLFTYETFRMTGNIGMSLAVLFVVLGFYYSFKQKYLLSGIFIGTAGITNFFSLFLGGVLFLYILLKKEKSKIKLRIKPAINFLIGFFIIFLLIQLVFILIVGKEYFLQVYQYHFMKPSTEVVKGIKLDLFKSTVIYNPIIFIGSLFYFLSRKKELSIFFTSVLVYIIIIFTLKSPFPYYYEMILPFLAVLASVSILKFVKRSENKNLLLLFLSIFILLNSVWAVSNHFWIINNTFSQNEHIELVEAIKQNSVKGDLIFGDQLFVPLIALMSERDIALNFVDTNPLRFQAGLVDVERLTMDLEKDIPKFIVIAGHTPFMNYDSSKNFLNNNCKITKVIDIVLPTQFKRNLINEKLYLLYCEKSEEE